MGVYGDPIEELAVEVAEDFLAKFELFEVIEEHERDFLEELIGSALRTTFDAGREAGTYD